MMGNIVMFKPECFLEEMYHLPFMAMNLRDIFVSFLRKYTLISINLNNLLLTQLLVDEKLILLIIFSKFQ